MEMKLLIVFVAVFQTLEFTSGDEVCEDNEAKCDYYWSRGWFSCDNGAALWRYCPKSCGLCPDEKCVDKRKLHCGRLKKAGYCLTMKDYMYKYCARTCGACTYKKKPDLIPGCRDYEKHCSKWAAYGQCATDTGTRTFCPKSCGICGAKKKERVGRVFRIQPSCKDRKPKFCRRSNVCLMKFREATRSCVKTCKMCGSNYRCSDQRSYCYYYKMSGFCKPTSTYYLFMTIHCKYSCNMC